MVCRRIVGVVVLLIGGVGWGCLDPLLYPRTNMTASEVRALSEQNLWQPKTIVVASGIQLSGLVRVPAEAPVGHPPLWLLFFGGNGMSLKMNQAVLEEIDNGAAWGLATWSYRGYDQSTGRPSQQALWSDAHTIASVLHQDYGVSPDRLILVGQSLGTGIAARLAADQCQSGTPPAALVLVAGYTSLKNVIDEMFWIPMGFAFRDRYPTDTFIHRVTVPTLIVHGTEDTLIAIRHGRALASILGQRATVFEVHRGHNDLWMEPPVVAEAVQAFIAGIEKDQRPIDSPAH